jgi:hypothetical protein
MSRSANVTKTPTGVLLRSDLGMFEVTGADVEAFVTKLVPLLDGSRDRAGIEAGLSGYSSASVAKFLDVLAERGLIEEVRAGTPDERWRGQVELLRRRASTGEDPMARLARARVLVAGSTPWSEVAADELLRAGIGAIAPLGGSAADPERDLILAAALPEDAAEIERIAQLAHRTRTRTLWSHLDAAHAVLGPLTVPGKTACRVCASFDVASPFGGTSGRGPRAAIAQRLLGHLLALEALEVLLGYTPTKLGGRALVQDVATFETTLHTLVRLPWCSVCGPRAATS